MPISSIAKAYVARKLEQMAADAARSCGLHYELYAQRLTESVDALADRIRNESLREYLRQEAQKTGDYFHEPGHWVIDPEGELIWRD